MKDSFNTTDYWLKQALNKTLFFQIISPFYRYLCKIQLWANCVKHRLFQFFVDLEGMLEEIRYYPYSFFKIVPKEINGFYFTVENRAVFYKNAKGVYMKDIDGEDMLENRENTLKSVLKLKARIYEKTKVFKS